MDEKRLPREDLKSFLQSLSLTTGLALSYIPTGALDQDLMLGETSFCLQVKATAEGDRRCRHSQHDLCRVARETAELEFSTCHAGLGMLAIPLRMDGRDMGVVLAAQAVMDRQDPDLPHRIEHLAGELGSGDNGRLREALSENVAFTVPRFQELGRFVRDQLFEKISSRDVLEDTTEYLLEKYEELMLLYSITENVTPGSDFSMALGMILEKGMQRLTALWGMFMLTDEDDAERLDIVNTAGVMPWPITSGEVPEPLRELAAVCSGPLMTSVRYGPVRGDGEGSTTVLMAPFKVKRSRRGYLLFGAGEEEGFDDGELRFTMALASQAASVIHTVQLNREMADLLFATLGALASAIDIKDPYTHGHSQRVADYAVMTARYMGFTPRFLTMLKIASQLHDFGKIGVREHILDKNGYLDKHEQELMNEHPAIGAHILERFKPFAEIAPGVRHHHERFDGKGYPDGLTGDDIPMVGRIITVADAFDAMTTTRPYRQRLELSDALLELEKNAGTQFDPEVVRAFIESFDRRRRDGQEKTHHPGSG